MHEQNHLETTICRVLARRDWRLTSFPEVACGLQQFTDRVRARLSSWMEEKEKAVTITPELIERAIKHEYCHILYRACNLRNTAAEERAMVELWHWTYPIVRSKIGHEKDAEDIAQQALIKIWEKSPQVKDPGAFLGWASMVTVNEVLMFYRRTRRRDQFVTSVKAWGDETPSDEDNEYAASLAAYEQALRADIANGLMLDESEQTILYWLEKCIPRSAAQRLVIMEHVVRERKLDEVANLLDTTLTNVYLLKHRALRSLRTCIDLLRMLCETVQPSRALRILGE